VPSPSAVVRYLARFHDAAQEELRPAGRAFIPAANEHLQGLVAVNRDLLAAVQRPSPSAVATLDMDATVVESFNQAALPCSKGYRSYQPHTVWWAEQGLVVRSEFRDGNVPAGFEQLRLLQEAEAMLPEGVKSVRMRCDSAGYQEELLRYCELGKSERLGRIQFAVAADVTQEFKKAVAEVAEEDWHPIYRVDRQGERHATSQQWAEVCCVPNGLARSTKGEYRFLAVREPLAQQPLPTPPGGGFWATRPLDKKNGVDLEPCEVGLGHKPPKKEERRWGKNSCLPRSWLCQPCCCRPLQRRYARAAAPIGLAFQSRHRVRSVWNLGSTPAATIRRPDGR